MKCAITFSHRNLDLIGKVSKVLPFFSYNLIFSGTKSINNWHVYNKIMTMSISYIYLSLNQLLLKIWKSSRRLTTTPSFSTKFTRECGPQPRGMLCFGPTCVKFQTTKTETPMTFGSFATTLQIMTLPLWVNLEFNSLLLMDFFISIIDNN